MDDFIWTPMGPIPRNSWRGNDFMMPPVVYPARRPAELLPTPNAPAAQPVNYGSQLPDWVNGGGSSNVDNPPGSDLTGQGERNATNSHGAVNVGPVARTGLDILGYVPGPLGLAATAASLGLAANNVNANNSFRGAVGLPGLTDLQKIGGLLGYNDYSKGLAGYSYSPDDYGKPTASLPGYTGPNSLSQWGREDDIDRDMPQVPGSQFASTAPQNPNNNETTNYGYGGGGNPDVSQGDTGYGGEGGSATGDAQGCFAAGVLITMADGSTKAIEDIRVGDLVEAYDERTQARGAGEVTALHRLERDGLVNVDGVAVSENHRFLAVDPEDGELMTYVAIGKLSAGDGLVNADGSTHPIRELTRVGGRARVYNFTVQPQHTYVANGWRVHNIKVRGGKVYNRTGRDMAPNSPDDTVITAKAGETVISKPATDYYGDAVMQAINSRQIPKREMRGLLDVANPQPAVAAYAGGGEVTRQPRGLLRLPEPERNPLDKSDEMYRTEYRDLSRGAAPNAPVAPGAAPPYPTSSAAHVAAVLRLGEDKMSIPVERRTAGDWEDIANAEAYSRGTYYPSLVPQDRHPDSMTAYARGGTVGGLLGPNPPGPDDGYGALDEGEYVVNAKAARQHRGLLDAINSGATTRKLRGLLDVG